MHSKLQQNRQKQRPTRNFIIDFVSNGGGDITSGYLMNDYLYRGNPDAPTFSRQVGACEWYDFIENPTIKYLIETMTGNLAPIYPTDESLKITVELFKMVNN